MQEVCGLTHEAFVFSRFRMLRQHFADIELESSVKPIPYSADVEFLDKLPGSSHHDVDSLKHKKVTIVGCGQVGV
jgi:hypothetical protein